MSTPTTVGVAVGPRVVMYEAPVVARVMSVSAMVSMAVTAVMSMTMTAMSVSPVSAVSATMPTVSESGSHTNHHQTNDRR